jgi:peptide/nickel transport system ATP-binding protein
MSAPYLEVEGLSVGFPTPAGLSRAVEDISFTLDPGETLGIVGESGSGKSLTCRSILRLLPRAAAMSGRVRLDGREVSGLEEAKMRAIRGRAAAMIFQNPDSYLDPLMRVGRQIGEGVRHHFGVSAAEARQAAIALLDDVRIPNPEHWVDAYPHELSGGMKQRVMIAAALACKPRLLIADEPTTALDVTVQARILTLLRELRAQRNLSIILVSHDLGVVGALCDRVLVMREGRIVEHGATARIVTAPRERYTCELIASQTHRLAQAAPRGRDAPPTQAEIAPLFVLRSLSVEFAKPADLLQWVRGRREGHITRAVSDVSLTVTPGEALGIVGESGSGKTTLARALVKLCTPAAGDVLYRGEPIADLRGRRLLRYRRDVQLVYQNPFTALNPRLAAGESIAEPLRRHGLCPRSEIKDRVAALMSQVELPPELASRRPSGLSGGQCQRVGIARALAMRPQVLIADEITSALDVTIQAQILRLLKRLQEEMGLTILLISHDLGLVRYFCDRVAVMRHGKLVEIGTVERIFAAPREAYTRALIEAVPKLPEAGASCGEPSLEVGG